jgi:hypothetical protein
MAITATHECTEVQHVYATGLQLLRRDNRGQKSGLGKRHQILVTC